MIDILYALVESTDCAGTTDRWSNEVEEAMALSDAWSKHCSAQHSEQRAVHVGTREKVTRTAPDAVTLRIDGRDHVLPLEHARALAVALGYVSAGER